MVGLGQPAPAPLDCGTTSCRRSMSSRTPGPSPRVEAVFAALADPTRRRLLDQLANDGPLNASQLARAHPVSRQAVVKHLAVLSGAGIITGHRHSNEVRYEVDATMLVDAASWLSDVGAQWDGRLGALRRHLEAPPPVG